MTAHVRFRGDRASIRTLCATAALAYREARDPATDDRLDDEDRAEMVARCIPFDVRLSDEADVIRALYAARLCYRDFKGVLDRALEIARERREQP